MTRELQPCPQYLFLKVLSKTRSPIIFITKRILRQVSSVVTKSLSVCFHTKTDVDFVSYRRERMIQYSFKIEMHSHFVFRTAKYSKKRLQQNPVRNVFGSGGCQLFRHMGGQFTPPLPPPLLPPHTPPPPQQGQPPQPPRPLGSQRLRPSCQASLQTTWAAS